MGLVATRPIEPDASVVIIPSSIWFTRKTPHTRHRPIVDAAQVLPLFSHSMSRLALLLALEHRDPDSFYRPYLDALGAPTVPYELTASERDALQGLPPADWIDEQRALADTECAALSRYLQESADSAALEPALWRWAYGHVMQRTFSVDIDEEEVWVMIPGVDLCNHADEPNTEFFAEEEGWTLASTRAIEAGEQISIRYGRVKTSADLLLEYGFVTPDNPHDRFRLELQLADDDPDHAEKLAAIGLLGLRTDALVGPDGSVPSAFLHAAILWSLDSETFRSPAPDVTAAARAIAALERVADAISNALACSPTTIEQDDESLRVASLSGWHGAFTLYRLNAKRLMSASASAIRQRIVDIETHGWRPTDVVEDAPDGRDAVATVVVPLSVR